MLCKGNPKAAPGIKPILFSRYGKWCLNNSMDEIIADEDAYHKSFKLMAEACLYISHNCTQPLTLDDVAKKNWNQQVLLFAFVYRLYTNDICGLFDQRKNPIGRIHVYD